MRHVAPKSDGGGRIVVEVAASVIRKADRSHPADAVLRSELREAGQRLSPAQRSEIADAVFNYYRWFGWLEPRGSIRDQIERASELARAFAEAPQKFSDDDLVRRSVPPWLSEFMEVTPAFARALQAPPKLWLRARRGQGSALAKGLDRARPSESVPDAVEYFGDEDLFRHPGFKSGDFQIQDIASQMVGRIADPQPGQTWWDACAGEGGKLLHLSELMENKGLIWASDRAAWRLEKLKRRTARARVFNYRAVPWDGSAKLPTRTKFDGILVDAPCSGVGTWGRNPHARWTTTPDDVRDLARVQRELLEHVLPALKPGGKLVYAVCTMTRPETVEVAEGVGSAHSELPAVSPTWIRSEDLGGNGMFVAVWEKR
jgi:16S rRNA (cytosine967-C5)-methyltransferase